MKKLLIALPMLILALTFVSAASMTLVSGPEAEYKDGDVWYNAVSQSWLHPEWNARIPGDSLPGASWMWRTDGVTAEEAQFGSNVMFRHQFNLGCAENIVGTISITTDNAFTLRVNSNYIAEDADWTTLATYDISEALKSGDNTLVVEAVNEPYATQDPHVNPAGVIYKVDITYDEKACGGDSVVIAPEVPEFGVLLGALALIGAAGVFLYKKEE